MHLYQTSIARGAKGTALRRRKRKSDEYRCKVKMTMNKYLSIITLNVNGLNTLIKRHKIDEWIRNHDPHICCV